MILGLAGYAGSGKSTAAEALCRNYGFVRARFADPLKGMIRTLLAQIGADEAMIDAMIEGSLKEVPSEMLAGRSPRYVMQTLGTDWGRGFMGPNFWADIAISRVRALHAEFPGHPIVFEDTRFANELAAIRKVGGVVLRIDRPGTGPVNAHESDNQRLDIFNSVTNDGTVEALEGKILDFMRAVGAG